MSSLQHEYIWNKKFQKIITKRQSRDSKLKHSLLKEELQENAQAYEAEFKASDKSLIDNMRKAKVDGCFYVPAKAKLILVIRIRGINTLNPQIRQKLRFLILRQLYNAVFVRINKATFVMIEKFNHILLMDIHQGHYLRRIRFIREVYAKINGQRIPLTQNIEEQLGKYGIHSQKSQQLNHISKKPTQYRLSYQEKQEEQEEDLLVKKIIPQLRRLKKQRRSNK